MTNRNIYTAALACLSESLAVSDNTDFEERAPYIIAMFICEAQYIDCSLRAFLGKSRAAEYDTVYADLGNTFPLLDRFSAPASLYLASVLIEDEDREFSEALYERYCDSMSTLSSNICGKSEKITQKYFSE